LIPSSSCDSRSAFVRRRAKAPTDFFKFFHFFSGQTPERGLPMKAFRYLSVAFLSVAVLFSAGCASTPNQSSLGEVIDDTVITTRVKTAIFNDPGLKVLEINVETVKGIVQLSGFVTTRAEINQAGTLARNVDGVQSVRNDILIK
jgi:osmotically-inducible protein OsmY